MAKTPYGTHSHSQTTQSNLTEPSQTTQSNVTAPSQTTQSNLTTPSQSIPTSSTLPNPSLQFNNGHDLWQKALLQMGGEFSSFARIIDYNRRDQVNLERSARGDEKKNSGGSSSRGGSDKDSIDKDNESVDKVMEGLDQLTLLTPLPLISYIYIYIPHSP